MAHTIRANAPETHTGAVSRFRNRTSQAVDQLAQHVQWSGTIAPTNPELEAKISAALYPSED